MVVLCRRGCMQEEVGGCEVPENERCIEYCRQCRCRRCSKRKCIPIKEAQTVVISCYSQDCKYYDKNDKCTCLSISLDSNAQCSDWEEDKTKQEDNNATE